MAAVMEKDQGVNLLSEAAFPLLESPVEKQAPNKPPEKPSLQEESSNVPNYKNLSFPNNKSVRPYNNNASPMNSSQRYENSAYVPHELRPSFRNEHMHELMHSAGIGRGKNRAKFSSANDSDAIKCDPQKEANFVDKNCTEGVDLSCSYDVKKNSKLPDDVEVGHLDVSMDRLHEPENSEKCTEMKTVPKNSERFQRNTDFRHMQNGLDSVHKGYRGKQYRTSRMHNNNMPPVQFKGFENRQMGKHFPMSSAPNMLRTGKGNESLYRHDTRRNQTLKPPFPNNVDKIVYSKFRPNSKDISYDGNRNLSRGYGMNKNEINSHMQSAADQRPSVPSYRRRSFGNKNDHVHSVKNWAQGQFYMDMGGAPVNNQGRTPVTSLKSDSYHYGNYFPGKGGHIAKFSHRADFYGPLATNQIEFPSYDNKPRAKPFSAGNRRPFVRDDSVETVSSEPPVLASQFSSLSDPSGSLDMLNQYSNSKGVCIVSEEEEECGSTYSSHTPENDSLPKPPGAEEHVSSDYEDLCSPVASSQTSYAEIIHAPVPKSPILQSPLSTQKGNASAATSPDFLTKDSDQAGSSEWVLPRLTPMNAGANSLHNINGSFQHQVPSSQHDASQPRPMAVNLEKPSFYNASLGKMVGTSSHSSPEKKMLECQFVEEQLCKKEKSNYFSETPSTSHKERAISHAEFGFSDSSSICSSTSSSTFKAEPHSADIKCSIPPVIIMDNIVPLENVDISFGIEIDEIIKICSEQPSCDACVLPSNCALHQPAKLSVDRNASSPMHTKMSQCVVVGEKKFLWKSDTCDVSKCNMRQIVDFLQETWNQVEIALGNDGDNSDKVRYYKSN